MKHVVFLPMRSGSKRVPKKNIRPLPYYPKGLAELKLSQLLNVKEYSKIIVSTDDEEIFALIDRFDSGRIILDRRPKEYASDFTTTDDLINYAGRCLVKLGFCVNSTFVHWTHVTAPFYKEDDYINSIRLINGFWKNQRYDSLMTVKKMQTFIWDSKGPINYNRDLVSWPFSQTIAPLYEVTSSLFICRLLNYIEKNDRITESVFFHVVDELQGFDIDTESQFLLSEKLIRVLHE